MSYFKLSNGQMATGSPSEAFDFAKKELIPNNTYVHARIKSAEFKTFQSGQEYLNIEWLIDAQELSQLSGEIITQRLLVDHANDSQRDRARSMLFRLYSLLGKSLTDKPNPAQVKFLADKMYFIKVTERRYANPFLSEKTGQVVKYFVHENAVSETYEVKEGKESLGEHLVIDAAKDEERMGKAINDKFPNEPVNLGHTQGIQGLVDDDVPFSHGSMASNHKPGVNPGNES